MGSKRMQGEGNKEADRRYRKGVRRTVEKTTAEERAEDARRMSRTEREEAEAAEKEGRSKARS